MTDVTRRRKFREEIAGRQNCFSIGPPFVNRHDRVLRYSLAKIRRARAIADSSRALDNNSLGADAPDERETINTSRLGWLLPATASAPGESMHSIAFRYNTRLGR